MRHEAHLYLGGLYETALESHSVLEQIISFLNLAPQVEKMALFFVEEVNRIERYEHLPDILWTRIITDVSEIFDQVTWPGLTHMKFKKCGMSEDAPP